MEQELPAQIQRQIDEAEAIEAAIASEQSALEAPQVQDTAPTEPIPEPVVDTAPEPQVKALPAAEEETWHSRFNTLQGKFNAEVPRLYQQLKESNHALAAMQTQMDQMKQPSTVQEAQTVTPEDEEAFGSDLIAVIKKVAKQETAEVVRQTEARVKEVSQRVDSVREVQAETASDKFFGAIEKAVPDWEVINTDAGWLEWLGEYSPETGAPRQASLDAASQSLDSARTIALFNLYKSKKPVATPSTVDNAQQELQRQVAPPKTAASTAPPAKDRVWSGDEYERAFDVRLTQTMTESEVAEIQVEAERAYNEGRIRW